MQRQGLLFFCAETLTQNPHPIRLMRLVRLVRLMRLMLLVLAVVLIGQCSGSVFRAAAVFSVSPQQVFYHDVRTVMVGRIETLENSSPVARSEILSGSGENLYRIEADGTMVAIDLSAISFDTANLANNRYTLALKLSDANGRESMVDVVIVLRGFDAGFVTQWNVTAASANNITIPTVAGETYNYSVAWGDGSSDLNQSASVSHTYATSGTYTVVITGVYPRIQLIDGAIGIRNAQQLIRIDQWGNIEWSSMEQAFNGAGSLTSLAIDAPDLRNVTDMNRMFSAADVFNGDIGHWDVSNVTNMSEMFADALLFNQPLDSWDVSSVTDMSNMFASATIFNQPLDSWDVSSAINMSNMFRLARDFNQPINSWDVRNVTNTSGMFTFARTFNQPLDSWDVSSVTDMSNMFSNTQVFAQDLSSWTLNAGVSVAGMLSGASGFANCPAFLPPAPPTIACP